MRAEILSIGSEMTSGQNFDTNGPWLSRALAGLGIATAFRTTLGDDPEDNRQAFRLASERADVVVSTGGLGPTRDDLTREILAELAGVPLDFHAESWGKILEIFSARNRRRSHRLQIDRHHSDKWLFDIRHPPPVTSNPIDGFT